MQIFDNRFYCGVVVFRLLVMCDYLLVHESYGDYRLDGEQMKLTQKQMYSFDMSKYDIEEENASGANSEVDYKFELHFNQEVNGEIAENCLATNEVEVDELCTQLAQKDRDLLLAAELGKALLEKNEELSVKYERLSEDYSQRTEVSYLKTLKIL